MNREQELRDMIRRIDYKGYPNYKQLKGSYQFSTYELRIHHVQGDPFAAPSSVSVKVAGTKAGFPPICTIRRKRGLHCKMSCCELSREF